MQNGTRHFSGDRRLKNITAMDNDKFAAAFPGVAGMRCDSFSMLVGQPVDGVGGFVLYKHMMGFLPVTRAIRYKASPSLHECNAKCLGGRHNGICECRCGGKNHGLGALAELAS